MKHWHKKRLKTLADFLMRLRKKFDITEVLSNDKVNRLPEIEQTSEKYSKTCGTVGCALGWAATIPKFVIAGFKCKNGEISYYKGKDRLMYSIPLFDGAKEFFGLTESESNSLFLRAGYEYGIQVTAKDVAKKIYQLLKDKENEVVS